MWIKSRKQCVNKMEISIKRGTERKKIEERLTGLRDLWERERGKEK